MKCRYCGADNHEDDRRCVRCMRRLTAPTPAPVDHPNRSSVAAAPAPQPAAGERPPASPDPPSRPRLVYQTPLFGPQVMPHQTPPEKRRGRRQQRSARQVEDASDSQQNLFLIHTVAASRTLKTSVEASIYCDAEVAAIVHRVFAAAVDVALVLMASGLLLAVFASAGGGIEPNARTWPVFAAIPFGVAAWYRLLWCIAGGDPPGMRWLRLRLLNFDGQRPSRRERFLRLLAGCLSLLAAGLGLLWALTDEEKLTWHDHISKTFPTTM